MPVIILTAKAQRKDVERGYEKGALFYVVKPFSNKVIRGLARYILEDLTEEEKERILFGLLG
jgi:DNA-binding response OmpR family regulator